jgi:hypothetical protein
MEGDVVEIILTVPRFGIVALACVAWRGSADLKGPEFLQVPAVALHLGRE